MLLAHIIILLVFITQPPDQRINSTWLFDVFADPLEEHDLSSQLPAVVDSMGEFVARFPGLPSS